MAEERKAKPAKSVAAEPAKMEDEVARLRRELDDAKLAHRLQKLDSPTKLRTLRRDLARALTRERQARIAAMEQSK